MTSIASGEEEAKASNCSQPSSNDIFSKKMINLTRRSRDYLSYDRCLVENKVKRIKAFGYQINRHYKKDDGEFLKKLASVIRTSKTLQDLDLEFSSSSLQDQDLKILYQIIKGQKSIKIINIDIRSHEISDEGIKSIRQGLRNLVSLKEVELNLNFCYGLTRKGVQSFHRCLQALSRLQVCSLGTTFNDPQVESLGRTLKNLNDLQNVSLQTEEDGDGEGMRKFGQNMKNCRKLQNMRLVACLRGFSDTAMENLGQGIKALTSLSDLQLRCSGLNISDEGVLSFGNGLGELASLKSLDFSITHSDLITDTGLYNLGLGLRKLDSLQNLKLRFDTCESEDFCDMKFFEPLLQDPKCLASLKSLELIVSIHHYLTEKTLQNLGLAFPKLYSLQNLRLGFPLSEEREGFGMQLFGEGLKSLSSLQTLDLNFDCDIQEREFQNLGEAFGDLSYLKTLNLTFGDKQFTEEGIHNLTQYWRKLPLENLMLKILDDNFTNELLQILGKCLNEITSLKEVSINIGSNKVDQTGKDNFLEIFKDHQCYEEIRFNNEFYYQT